MDLSWGSPVGLGIFFVGAAAVLWAISKLIQASDGDDPGDD